MSWEEKVLSDISEIGDGAHASLKRVPQGIPYLTAKNITKDGIDDNAIDYISEETYNKHFKAKSGALTKPEKNDILYSIIGSIGGVYVVQDEKIGISSSVAIFRPQKNIIDPLYLAYYMKSKIFDSQIQAIRGGVAQSFMSLSKLGSVKIKYPSDLKVQRKIISIISLYDDLIENNQKQIELLEEAAQRLYKEWFVDLRFPGYENVKIVDDVPEGWKEGNVGDIVIFHDKKRKPLSSNERKKFCGQYRYYGAAGIIDYVRNYIFDGKYLLFGEDGTVITNDGFPVLQYVSGKFWANNHTHVLTGKPPFSSEFLYLKFSKMGISDVVTGVAQPKISQARLSAKRIIIPSSNIVVQFDKKIKSMFERKLLLEKQIINLQEARDRLLPKLISGEIEL